MAAVEWKKGKFLIRIWDVMTGKEKFSTDVVRNGEGSEFASFSPDGTKLLVYLSGSPAVKGTYCWDIATGNRLWHNKENFNWSLERAPTFSADGTMILSSQPPLDVATGQPLRLENMPPLEWRDQIIAIPGAQTLLVSNAKGILVWDMATAQKVHFLDGAGDKMLLARDGKTLITNSGTLQRWDLATGKALYRDTFDHGHQREVTALMFSADGRKLASAGTDGSVRLWDVATNRPIHAWRGHEAAPYRYVRDNGTLGVQALDMTPDGCWILSAGSEERLCVWDATSGKEVCTFPLPPEPAGLTQSINYVRISQDGKKAMGLFGGDHIEGRIGGEDYFQKYWLAYWDLPKGTLLGNRSLEKIRVRTGSLSRDGKILVSSVGVLSLDSFRELAHLEGQERNFATNTSDAISPDGALVARDFHPDIVICEMATGKTTVRLKNKAYNCQMAFHPNSRLLAVDDVNAINLWDVVTGKVVATYKMPKGHDSHWARGSYTSCLAFTPDGRRLATGHPDGTILLWNIDLPTAQTVRLAPKEVDSLWAELKDGDAAKAWRAVWCLADSPEEVVPFLRKQLKPFTMAPGEITRPLLANLSSESFAKRDAANKRLQELGLSAEPALRDLLKDNPPLETQRRVEALLKTIVETPQPLTLETLRSLREIAVLARMRSPEAHNILEGLTKGVESARLTCAANAAQGR